MHPANSGLAGMTMDDRRTGRVLTALMFDSYLDFYTKFQATNNGQPEVLPRDRARDSWVATRLTKILDFVIRLSTVTGMPSGLDIRTSEARCRVRQTSGESQP